MRVPGPRWHYLYFVLAAFDVLTVCAGLTVTHSIMGIYRESVAVSQTWAERANSYSALGELAAAVNGPGNDVFRSHDPDAESRKAQEAKRDFDKEFGVLREELRANLTPEEAAPLLAKLTAVATAMEAMTEEARLIFASYRANRTDRAAERMATMDDRFAAVNRALAALRDSVANIQKQNFEHQTAAAAQVQKYEYMIGALVLLMVAGGTLYGHRMARSIQSSAAEKELHLQEIGEAHALLQQTNGELQALFMHTLEAQEEQRQQVARELHEEVAQMLASLKMRLSALPYTRNPKNVEPHVKAAGTIAETAINRLQDLVRDLTPHGMELVGLAGVLVVRLKEWTRGSKLAVHFSEQLADARPPFRIETAAYRVAEAAVENVARHAHARNLHVALRQVNEELHLHVEDDGVGFDVASASRMGITLMEQRTALLGGKLQIVSKPGHGTRVTAVFPATA